MEVSQLEIVVEIFRDALFTTLKVSLPLLGVGLFVGLLVGILQAVTQVQEQTLVFIPKILAVVATLVLLLPLLLRWMVEYTARTLGALDALWPGGVG